MGLDRQPNNFVCGPYALKHALTTLGVIADPQQISRLAKTHWWSGTDEVRLARAARAYKCDMPLVRKTDEVTARKAMVRALNGGHPVITCVDEWEHWIVVVHHEKGRFVAIDSREMPVIVVMTWKELAKRWMVVDADGDEEEPGTEIYDMFPVKLRAQRQPRARFSVARARMLRRPENHDVSLCWDQYLVDLLAVCRPRSPHHVEPLTLGEFLRRHQKLVVERVTYWHGGVERAEVQRVLRNLRFVADTYGMVIPSTGTRRAFADIISLVTLWAASKRPVEPLYMPPKKRKK
ncbi:MAG: hypothetical protein R3B48_00530 [Kofleriaceae bacterium]